MSRPKPTVLLQHSNKTTFKMDEVLAAEGIWAVFYDGKPINLKSSSLVANYPGPKYKKVSFSINFFIRLTRPPVIDSIPVSTSFTFQSSLFF